jgi:hypothetical protein
MRGWEKTVTEEKLIDQFFDFFNSSMVGSYTAYQKWFDSSAYCFKYEDIQKDMNVVNGLADYLKKPRPSTDFLSKIPGGTYTWTGETSDWRKYWTENLDRIWRDEGMVEIEKKLGYDNNG